MDNFTEMRQFFFLMRLDKPIGILLLLWPTLWGLWLASHGHPDPMILGIFITGVVLMRSAGCVINDIADRNLDPQVRRTRARPLAAGLITIQAAIVLFLILMTVAASLLIFLNPLTRGLALVAAALACIYPFLKRFTHLPQLCLGAAFSFGIPMAFAACSNQLPATAAAPFLAGFFWTVMYDTLYAMVDREDDLKAGIHSTAILFGQWDRTAILCLQAATLSCLVLTGFLFQLGIFFYLYLSAAGILFFIQHRRIRDHDQAACFQAFLNNQWVGLIIFTGIVAGFPS